MCETPSRKKPSWGSTLEGKGGRWVGEVCAGNDSLSVTVLIYHAGFTLLTLSTDGRKKTAYSVVHAQLYTVSDVTRSITWTVKGREERLMSYRCNLALT